MANTLIHIIREILRVNENFIKNFVIFITFLKNVIVVILRFKNQDKARKTIRKLVWQDVVKMKQEKYRTGSWCLKINI